MFIFVSNKEHFSLSDPINSIDSAVRSGAEDVESGASEMYNWGYHELGEKRNQEKRKSRYIR